MLSAVIVHEWLADKDTTCGHFWSGSLLSQPTQHQSRGVLETVFALQDRDGRGFNTPVIVNFALTFPLGRVLPQEQHCGTRMLTVTQGKHMEATQPLVERGSMGWEVMLKSGIHQVRQTFI